MDYKINKKYRHKCQNYTKEGYYFVTICTHNRVMYFGNIKGDGWKAERELSRVGRMAEKFWLEIPQHFSNIFIDEFVVMPNHIHGIIKIENNEEQSVGTEHCSVHVENKNSPRTEQCSVPTGDIMRFGNIPSRSVSSIVRSYKSAVTKWCKRNGFRFAWQSRFHDRIIRDDRELNDIRDYIHINPFKWSVDINNPYN